MRSLLQHFWCSPNSLLGVLGGLGGKAHLDSSASLCEFTGGWLIGLLRRRGWAEAITLGEVILYGDIAAQQAWRAHERVHVEQGRRWGPLFLPAYLLESAYQWLRTGDGYWNNRFERQAYHD